MSLTTIKLFGDQAKSVARKLEDMGKIEKWRCGKATIKTEITITIRSVEGHDIAELDISLGE